SRLAQQTISITQNTLLPLVDLSYRSTESPNIAEPTSHPSPQFSGSLGQFSLTSIQLLVWFAAALAVQDFVAGNPALAIQLAPPPLPAPQIWRHSYRGFLYEVPRPDAVGPFYCVTKGTRVGIFSGWQTASPFVSGVSHSCQSRVVSREAGYAKFHEVLEDDGVRVLVTKINMTASIDHRNYRRRQNTVANTE
ncbi:hypothetical protein BJ138DRAFT_1102954, partial [Hygrophoropsis aurantiaca]